MLQNNHSDRKTLKIPKLQNRTNSNYFITKIPCQDKENSVDDLVIANLDEQSIVQAPFLTFVPNEQIAEVTVQARTKWKMKQKKSHKNRRKAQKKKTKKELH